MIHVYPLNDVREHDTESTLCPCKPRIDWSGPEAIVVHHAWDHREVHEELERLGIGVPCQSA